jgi:hypothetical protein
VKGAEKRTDLELLSLKSAQLRNAVEIRWAHSEAHKQLHLFYRMGHKWRIVEDEERASARKRKLLGLEPLENRKSQGPEKEPETPWEPTELFFVLVVLVFGCFVSGSLEKPCSRGSIAISQGERRCGGMLFCHSTHRR